MFRKMCMRARVCMRICIYLFIFVCVCVCVCVHACLFLCVYLLVSDNYKGYSLLNGNIALFNTMNFNFFKRKIRLNNILKFTSSLEEN
jgi:hypothetical protein